MFLKSFYASAVQYINTIVATKMNFNMFWDLFLYTAFYCFVSLSPAKLKGGKMLLFRCCSLIPASWLTLSAILSSYLRQSMSALPITVIAALSTRNLSALAVFFLLILFQKYR